MAFSVEAAIVLNLLNKTELPPEGLQRRRYSLILCRCINSLDVSSSEIDQNNKMCSLSHENYRIKGSTSQPVYTHTQINNNVVKREDCVTDETCPNCF